MGYSNLFQEGYTIPKKLPKEEVYDLLAKTSQGDIDARKKLIEHNIRLVIYQVNGRFNTVEYDKSELVSIGILGLVKAVDTFDLSKKNEFSTYAIRCIDNEILMFLRKIKKDKDVESFDKPISGSDRDNELKLEDTLKSDIDIETLYEDKEIYEQIRNIVYNLPEKEREIILLYFGFHDGKTYRQKEIADKLSLSRSYISRIITSTVNHIRRELEKLDIVEEDLEIIKTRNKTKEKQKEARQIANQRVDDSKGEKGMSRKVQTLYQYFNTYKKEQIDQVISGLTEEEKALLNKRYGDNLSNPVQTKLTKEEYEKFYGSLLPKIKRKLKKIKTQQPIIKLPVTKEEQATDPNSNKINIEEPKQTIPSQPIVELDVNEQEKTKEEPLTKEDYLKMLELLRNPRFSNMLNKYSAKEKIIISLKLGYIDGKCFSTKSISEFLSIPEQEIITLTRKVLLEYQKMINSIFEGTIKMVTEKQEEKVFTKK